MIAVTVAAAAMLVAAVVVVEVVCCARRLAVGLLQLELARVLWEEGLLWVDAWGVIVGDVVAAWKACQQNEPL